MSRGRQVFPSARKKLQRAAMKTCLPHSSKNREKKAINMQRREFLRGVALAGIASRGARGLASRFGSGMQSGAGGSKEGGSMIFRILGKTGERVSAIGMGGFHIGQPK